MESFRKEKINTVKWKVGRRCPDKLSKMGCWGRSKDIVKQAIRCPDSSRREYRGRPDVSGNRNGKPERVQSSRNMLIVWRSVFKDQTIKVPLKKKNVPARQEQTQNKECPVDQWFFNFTVHQYCLGAWYKPLYLGTMPRDLNLGRGWVPRIGFS